MASDQKTAKTDKANTKASAKPVKASSGKPSKASQDKPNIFERLAKYLRDVRVEMQRVVWPNREEVIQSSLVVVVALAFFIVYVTLWDTVSQFLFIQLPSLIAGKGLG